MMLDQSGYFGNCSLCNSKILTRRGFDRSFIRNHLCGKTHLEEVEKKKHAEVVVAREKRVAEAKGIEWAPPKRKK